MAEKTPVAAEATTRTAALPAERGRPLPPLPDARELAALTGDAAAIVAPYLAKALLAPARELLARPSKSFRARLVRAAYALLRPLPAPGELAQERLDLAAAAIELLHAGSLIVDDVQDGSPVRRGGPSVHLLYGVPAALCTGNWLYFRPLRLLGALGLPPAAEADAYRQYADALERAHCGQALDLGVRIDDVPRLDAPRLCRAVLELKTGSITSLAMALGTLIAGADERRTGCVADFGRRFGTALQLYDDVGNLLGRVDPSKRYEDLVQRKPSGVWALAAELVGTDYLELLAATRALPDAPAALEAWLARHDFLARATERIETELDAAMTALRATLGVAPLARGVAELASLGEALRHAYG